MVKHSFEAKKFRVKEGDSLKLSKISTKAGNELSKKEDGVESLRVDNASLQEAQNRLFAGGKRSVLVVLQGMDASGKDGTVRHVISGVNPQGCRIYSFRAPNTEEVQHHFLWRPMRFLPSRGMISIFNRSYYEEVLIARIRPQILQNQHLPEELLLKGDRLWQQRFKDINHFEQYLTNNGIVILKFFLNISKDEQKQRFLKRIDTPKKNWKFSMSDVDERQQWNNYQTAYEDMFNNTSTDAAPWHIIPADRKWYTRLVIADIITQRLASLDLSYPKMTQTQQEALKIARDRLCSE